METAKHTLEKIFLEMIEKIKKKTCINIKTYKCLFIGKRTHFVKQIIKSTKKVNFPENIKSVKRIRDILVLTCNSKNTF